MKGTIVSMALVLMGPRWALAGTPQEITAARERFEKARVPVFADLSAGQAWNCQDVGEQGPLDDSQLLPLYLFKNAGAAPPHNDGGTCVKDFDYDPKSLAGSCRSEFGRYTEYIRVGDDGALIVEAIMPETRWTEFNTKMPSVIDKSQTVFSYYVCPAGLRSASRSRPQDSDKSLPTLLAAPRFE